MDIAVVKVIMAGVTTLFAGIMPAFAEGWVASKAMEAMGRNPEAADKLFSYMIVGQAVCESTAIYGLVISFIILFAV
jgi:F-type H+-transporting ATPase subunit c